MPVNTYSYPVVRWPFDIDGSSLTVRFNDGVGGTTDKTLANVTYVIDGIASVGPTDLVQSFETLCQLAYNTLHAANNVDVTMEKDGTITVDNTAANQFNIEWTAAQTTLDAELLGFSNAADTDTNLSSVTSEFLAHYQWHPGVYARWDDPPEIKMKRRAFGKTLNGEPHKVVFADGWFERTFEWQFVAAARVFDFLADVSAYATYAGWTVLEDMTFENLLAYLDEDSTTASSPEQVYIYSTNDPATAVQSAIYKVTRTNPDLYHLGVEARRLRGDIGAAHFRIELGLWRAA